MLTALGAISVVVLILANGYFVAGEFAFVAARRRVLERDRAQGDRRAERALRVRDRLSFMLSGAQLGITVTSLVVGFIAGPALGGALEPVAELAGVPQGAVAVVAFGVAFGLATVAQMVVGELAPKNLAIARPEPIAKALATSTLVFLRLAGGVIRLFDHSANRLLRWVGIEPIEEPGGGVSLAELEFLVDDSEDRGVLSARQAAFLERAIEFPRLAASGAMVPRGAVDTVPPEITAGALHDLIRRGGHTRLPVVDPTRDDVLGVIHTKDLLGIPIGERDTTPISTFMRPAYFVPESARLPTVLDGLRNQHTELAVVLDEHGDIAGVITLEDIVEELVGPIVDEHDPDEPAAELLPDKSWVVPGSLRIDEIERETGVVLPHGDYETVAGLILARLGRLAVIEDEVSVDGVRLRVVETDGHAIIRVQLHAATEPIATEPDGG